MAKRATEPLNAVNFDKFHRYTIFTEQHGREQWDIKFGPEFSQKFAESQTIGETIRKAKGLPPSYEIVEEKRFRTQDLPQEYQKTVHFELQSDRTGIFQGSVDGDLFNPYDHGKKHIPFD